MKILLSLILSLSVPFASAAEAERDEDLWNSLVHLNQQYRDLQHDVLLTMGPQLATLTTTGVGLFFLARHVREVLRNGSKASPANMQKAVRLVMPAAVIQLVISGYLIHRHTPDRLSIGERYVMFLKNEGPRALAELADLWAHPLPEQYQMAIARPELHQYLIDLDAWLKNRPAQAQPQPPTSLL
jgi:hypothetical protein